MKINRLELINMRAFKQAVFKFKPGMNLLVGVNGVGKTTVLDALRFCLSRVLRDVTSSRSGVMSFNENDMRVETNFMTVTCTFELQGEEFSYVVHRNRERIVSRDSENVREQTWETPNKSYYQPPLPNSLRTLKKAQRQPLGLFFSTRRSLVSNVAPSKTSVSGGQAAAFANALFDRELRLSEIADWMRAQERLGAERPVALKHLAALRRAAQLFMPDYVNLRVSELEEPQLIVDKGGTTLNISQLSDGERGMFVLALDIAKRLSQANPLLDDPVKDGDGVVLIDEIDLHLHPRWQRNVATLLIKTFSSCQFIATTHSPQVIGEVAPSEILILGDSEVSKPERSYGIDSSRILEELMDTEPRNASVGELLRRLHKHIDEEDFSAARELLSAAEATLGADDPEITRVRTLMAFLEDRL